jgi:oligopeptide transport system substrate-binding protein
VDIQRLAKSPRPIGLVIACIALLTLFFAYDCFLGIPRPSGPVRVKSPSVSLNLGSEPPTLDPIRVTDLTSMAVVNQLMVGLTRLDGQSRLVPGLATHWQVSPDGKTYTFWLNASARWHDGKPVTAQHVLDGIQRALTPVNGSEYAFFLFSLVNAKAFYDGQLTDFKQVGVRVVTPYKLVMQLQQPVSFFLSLMAFPVAYPARQDVINRYGDTWTEAGHFVGNGPYQLAQWRHDDTLRLQPVASFWLPSPGVRPWVNFLMINDANTSMVLYENQQLDMVESPTTMPAYDIRRVKHQPDYTETPLAVINYLGMNQQKPPFNDVRVRQAFAYALDRATLTQLLQAGQTPLTGFVTPGMLGYNPTIGLRFNPQKARQLLAQAGYPDGKGFPEVTLAFRDLYDVRKECQVVQYLWKKHLGITVRLQSMDWKIFLNQLKTDAPAVFKLNWYVDYPDPDSFLGLFQSDNGNNYTRWHNLAYDQQIQKAAAMLNHHERQQAYEALQRQLLEQHTVIIPTYTLQKSMLLSPQVSGLRINSLNILDLWHMEKRS